MPLYSGVCKVFVTIVVNLVNNVSVFDTPFVPLGLAICWINAWTIHLSTSVALENHISAPSVRKVYRERIHENPSTTCAKAMRIELVLYNPPRSENILKLTLMVIG